MPEPAYLELEGKNQGSISEGCNTEDSMGNDYQEGFEDMITVQAFRLDVHRPTNPQTGQPTGPRTLKPLTLTKFFDKSSPLLYQALATGERMETWTLKFYRTTPEGEQEHYFTIALEDATIVDIHGYMPNALDSSNESLAHLEDVSFAFNKITWTHEAASTEGEDSWKERPAG